VTDLIAASAHTPEPTETLFGYGPIGGIILVLALERLQGVSDGGLGLGFEQCQRPSQLMQESSGG
jgi:hypothetical protein